MTTSIIDSYYFKDMFTSDDMHNIFSEEQRMQAWLDFESGLARAQARLGIIPASAAAEISLMAKVDNLDLEAMKKEFDVIGLPIPPLVHQLSNIVSKESSRYVHWGSTTQDVTDTGMVLQIRNGLELFEVLLTKLQNILGDLSRNHKNTIMVGRTMQQQAAPITFGFKTAIWLSELQRHMLRLEQLKQRVLVGQVGGAVGTNATLGNRGIEVLHETMVELNLGSPDISWHVARDNWVELVNYLALVGGSLAKIANEVAILMRSEVNEISEPFEAGAGASSTLPQKRNPKICQAIIASGKILREKSALSHDTLVQEHERGVGTMHLEWSIIPEAFVLSAGQLENTIKLLDGIVVNEHKMKDNLNLLNGLVMSESVMMGLANHVGRSQAHTILYEVCIHCVKNKQSLKEGLLNDDRVNVVLGEHEIDELLKPSNYLGCAIEMVDRVLQKMPD